MKIDTEVAIMSIPPELVVQHIHRINKNEWAGACPNCGGHIHQNGDLPDRFRVFLRSRATGDVLGWCRRCDYKWTPNKNEKPDPVKLAEWEAKNIALEESRIKKQNMTIERLQLERPWERYWEEMDAEIIEDYYVPRGINYYWVDEWKLGYNPYKAVWKGDAEHVTPALTIPIFELGTDRVLNVRNRLLNPLTPDDKYRPEVAGLPSSLYFTDRKTLHKKVLIVEGEFKSMTTYLNLESDSISVVGLPGKTPSEEILKPLDDAEVVYILLDPDAYIKKSKKDVTPVHKLIKYFGSRSRVITLPYKVDDMILDGILGKKELRGLIASARRAIIDG